MWLIFFWLFQTEQTGPRAMNAQIYLRTGEKVELVAVTIKGPDPYEFEFKSDGGSSHVSIYNILRINRVKGTRDYQVLFNDGETKIGRIPNITLRAETSIGGNDARDFPIYHLERVVFISGSQLRHCPQAHFEKFTPHPFCPICGAELELGPFEEMPEEEEQPSEPPLHRWRLDPRNPASGPIRRGN